jgi:cell wall-associated NlpC family hydrolase
MTNAPAVSLDPRVNAFRPDLADSTLSALVKAERYVEPKLRQSQRGVTPLLATPDKSAQQVSQIRYGEFVDVFETNKDGYVWAQNRTDRYVGYLPPTHTFNENISDLATRVNVPRTFLYPEPTIKSPPLDELTLGSFVTIEAEEKDFFRLTAGGYVFARHVSTAASMLTPDYVFTAGRLLNTPYLWGGRTPKGLDCSGLVQLVLEMAGIDCPRDSDQQRETFGKPLPRHWRDMPWQRGDLVFFAGHVGIMTSPDHIIHASGHHMYVTVEPLAEAIMARGLEVTAGGNPAT